MVTQPYVPPEFKKKAFNCPHCNAYANQRWYPIVVAVPGGVRDVTDLQYAECDYCSKYSIWQSGKLAIPDSSPAPLPNPDLPEDIKKDYDEARSIITRSPRGAAALLRLCLQKLCEFLGESGKDLNKDIASLVNKGLNPKIQKSLDIVRVIGNESVHPGKIDLGDRPETALQLCHIVNIIADTMISQPKMINGLYEQLPETKREQIEKRDARPHEGRN